MVGRPSLTRLRALAWTLLLVFAGGWTPAAGAHSPARALTQLSHRGWQTEDGLPQNSALSLTRTPDGYLWFGTWEGLVRFDGVHFTVFDRNNTPALQGKAIRALTSSPDGTLWVGSDEGLVQVRGDVFTPLAPPSDGPALRNVRTLLEVEGVLWVGTRGSGLWRLQEGRWQHWPASIGGEPVSLLSLARDASGTLWVGSSRGLLRLAKEGAALEHVPLPGGDGAVDTVAPGRHDTLWVGLRSGRLLRVRPGGRVEPHPEGLLEGHSIEALLEDAQGSLWVGTSDAGLLRLAEGKLDQLTAEQGLVSASVESLLEDAEGNLWVGTDGGGLHRLKEGVAVPFGVDEGLPVPMTTAVLQARDGSLWASTDGGGVVRLVDGHLTRFDTRQGLHTNQVRIMGEDSAGSLWFGGRTGGLTRLQDGTFTRWGPERGVRWDYGRAFAEDETGTLYVATDRGLARRVGERFEVLPLTEDRPSPGVTMVGPAREGGLWLTLEGGGLARFREGRLEVLPTQGESLRGSVASLHEDARGVLWVGSSAGLFRYESGRLFRFGREHGLHDDVAFAVLEDAQGRLWMSCNRGVYRVPRAELDAVAHGERTRVSARVFGLDDGMKSAECNGLSSPNGWRSRDGRLWFPTIRGLVAFQEEEEATLPTAQLPPVRLESVTVDGTSLPAHASLTLPKAVQRVGIHYTAPWLRSPEQVRFRYRLEGVDTGWVEAQGERTAWYTHLPPGEFHLRVMARRLDGPWEEAGAAQLRLVVPHRLHQTLWFRVLCVLGLCGLLAGAVSWQLQRHRRRERELETRVRERTAELAATNAQLDAQYQALQEAKARLVHAEKMAAVGTLAAGVGHEINNPLAYILNNVHFLRITLPRLLASQQLGAADQERAAQAEQALADTLEGVERVRRIVQDLRAFSRAEPEQRSPVQLEQVLELSLNMAASALRHRARVVRRFEDVPPVLGDSLRLGQLFLNLLVNAAQALPEGQAERHEVRVSLLSREGRVGVEVADTGSGIPAEVLPRIFEPFFTTKPVGEGTGLGLSICHAIVQSHGGDIQVESREGEGTTFRVWLRALEPAAKTGS